MCNIYLNPIRNGGGYSIAEAMFYGLPVLNIKDSEAGDSCSGLENSLNNYEEYIEKIKKLYKDKEYYNINSKKMKEKIENAGYKKYLSELF